MNRLQYQTISVFGQSAKLLVTPQAVTAGLNAYLVERVVNYDPQTGQMGSGQALLYHAIDQRTGIPVAVKQLLHSHDADARERHRRESTFLLSGKRHPNIVRGIEVFQDGSEKFLVMEWIEGSTLAQRLQQNGPLSEAEAVDYLKTLARTLHFLHRAGWLFRDLNEGNMMFPASGSPPIVIIDFGGIVAMRAPARSTHLVPPSVAPEILQAHQQGTPAVFSPATDVYALATIGYCMLTGQYVPDDRRAHRLAPPRTIVPHLSRGLEALLLRMLDIDPLRRPGTPIEVVRELEALQAGQAQPAVNAALPLPALAVAPVPLPVSARPQPHDRFGRLWQAILSQSVRLWHRRRRAVLAGGAGLIGLGICAMLLPIFGRGGTKPAHQMAGTGDKPPGTNVARHVGGESVPLWGQRIRLHTAPTLSSSILGELSAPKRVRVLSQSGGWCRIETSDGMRGYVWSAFVPGPTEYKCALLKIPLPSRGLDAGSKVVVVARDARTATLLLPDGAKATVALRALAFPKP
jgi:hypothetical protein